MKDTPGIIEVKYSAYSDFFVFSEKDERFLLLDEKLLAKQIPGCSHFNEKTRKKEFKKFVERCEIVKKREIPHCFPNTFRTPRFRKLDDQQRDCTLRTLLSLSSAFKAPFAGHCFLADLLCAQHCRACCRLSRTFLSNS